VESVSEISINEGHNTKKRHASPSVVNIKEAGMKDRDLLYKLVTSLGFPFSYECVGLPHIRVRNPAVFIANHLGSLGPIQTILAVPLRMYPWVSAEMTDLRRAPLYLYDDFIHPAWHLHGYPGLLVSRLVSLVSVRLLNGIGAVPIDRSQGVFMESYHRSLNLLRKGKNLLIFPEDSNAALDPQTDMCPFMRGFVLLSPMYYHLTGCPLPFYPVAVSSQSKRVAVGKPLYYDLKHGQNRDAVAHFCTHLQGCIARMYTYLQRSRVLPLDESPSLFGQEMPDEEELEEVKVGNR
jgi:hypothetical protein